MAYALNLTFDFGSLTGLTLNGKLYDSAGAQTGATVTSGFVEIGNGVYSYLAALPDGHVGTFVAYKSTDATVKVALSINPQEAENCDQKTSTPATLADGAITAAKITLPAEAAGRPATLLGMLRRLFEWAANKKTRDRETGALRLLGADDTTVLDTQTQSTTGSVDAQTRGV